MSKRAAWARTNRRVLPTLLTGVAMVMALLATAPAAAAASTSALSGTMYFTTYQNYAGTCGSTCTPNVFDVGWSYANGQFALTTTPAALAATQGADGILFAPGGNDLLIGGQRSNQIYDYNLATTAITQEAAGKNAYHLALDPSGNSVWSFGQNGDNPGAPTQVPLPVSSQTSGTVWQVTYNGATYGLTQVAFVPVGATGLATSLSTSQLWEGQFVVFYTSSGDYGGGDFGYLIPDASAHSFVAHPLVRGAAWTHALWYDSLTGDLMAAGSNVMAQIDPSTATTSGSSLTVSTYTAQNDGAGLPPEFDQVVTDGLGHLFATDNHGYLYFDDYSQSGMVATGTVTDVQLATDLDDLAIKLSTTSSITGFVTGGGWVTDPSSGLKGTFGLVAKNHATGPQGSTEFQLHGADINFHSTAYTSLTISGCWATYSGTGTINGAGSYDFTVTVKDDRIDSCGGHDEFGITITNPTTGTNVYKLAPQNVLQGTGIQIHE